MYLRTLETHVLKSYPRTWSHSFWFTASVLAWQTALKKTEVKLDLLTDIDMLLMVKKAIRGGICCSIYQYAEANNKYMKDYDKNKESSQKYPINNSEWINYASQFNGDLNYN